MSSRTTNFSHSRFFLVLFLALLVITACGRTRDTAAEVGGEASSPSSDRLAAPTMPAGQFTAVGEQSVLTSTAVLTETAPATQSTQMTQTTAVALPDLSRGEAAYTKNKCGDCHGAQGEGVADKGNAIAGTAITFEEFDQVLRTGGGLGNTHIFGRSAVSPSGMEALYAHVQSLGQ